MILSIERKECRFVSADGIYFLPWLCNEWIEWIDGLDFLDDCREFPGESWCWSWELPRRIRFSLPEWHMPINYNGFISKTSFSSGLPVRIFTSLLSSGRLGGPRFARKNEKPEGLSAFSKIRVIAELEANDGLAAELIPVATPAVVVVGGIAGVPRGSAPMVEEMSKGTARAGFLMKDKNKWRHNSSGISELSTNNSKNCRNPG